MNFLIGKDYLFYYAFPHRLIELPDDVALQEYQLVPPRSIRHFHEEDGVLHPNGDALPAYALAHHPVPVQYNRLLLDPSFDLQIFEGPVQNLAYFLRLAASFPHVSNILI
jgi:hypothetical protein